MRCSSWSLWSVGRVIDLRGSHGGAGQLEVDVLQRRTKDAQAVQTEGVFQRPAGQLVKRTGQILWRELHGAVARATSAQPWGRRDAVGQGEANRGGGGIAPSKSGRRTFGDDPAFGNDRDAVGELLCLVHVV